MSDPFFSIVSTARNAGPHARRSIESVLAQTEKSWELWFVDDASADNTWPQALLGMGLQHTLETTNILVTVGKIVCLHRSERWFKLANFLDCVKRSHGSVLVELDGDDFFSSPDSLATIRRAYSSSPLIDATAGSHHGYPSGSILRPCLQPLPGHRIMQNGFADSVPAPRTWKRHLTERSLSVIPEIYTDPETGRPWRTNADLALFAPALFWARIIHPIEDVLVEVTHDGPSHDHVNLDEQRVEGMRLYEILYQMEWKFSEHARKVPS